MTSVCSFCAALQLRYECTTFVRIFATPRRIITQIDSESLIITVSKFLKRRVPKLQCYFQCGYICPANTTTMWQILKMQQQTDGHIGVVKRIKSVLHWILDEIQLLGINFDSLSIKEGIYYSWSYKTKCYSK